MGIYKKGFCAVISILLCSILITSTAISGTFAKFTVNDSSSDSARVSKWGIELSSSTGLTYEYADGDVIYLTSKTDETDVGDNIIAPGTRGVLAEITIKGTPETAYNIDFSGTLTLGKGFKKSAGYIREKNDTTGKMDAIDYFPIALFLVETDNTNGKTVTVKAAAGLTRKGNTLYLLPSTGTYTYKGESFTPGSWNGDDLGLDGFLKIFNSESAVGDPGTYRYLDVVFDSANDGSSTTSTGAISPNTTINKTYSVEWEWLYSRGEGNYQTAELDTQLGEAMRRYPKDFNITLDFSVAVSQVD